MSKEGLQTVVNNSSKDAGGSSGGGGGADSGLAANLMSAGKHELLGVRHDAAHWSWICSVHDQQRPAQQPSHP